MTSHNDYDVIDIMTFCNCNVTVTRLICMFITRVKYDIYWWQYYMDNGLCYIIKVIIVQMSCFYFWVVTICYMTISIGGNKECLSVYNIVFHEFIEISRLTLLSFVHVHFRPYCFCVCARYGITCNGDGTLPVIFTHYIK